MRSTSYRVETRFEGTAAFVNLRGLATGYIRFSALFHGFNSEVILLGMTRLITKATQRLHRSVCFPSLLRVNLFFVRIHSFFLPRDVKATNRLMRVKCRSNDGDNAKTFENVRKEMPEQMVDPGNRRVICGSLHCSVALHDNVIL